METSWKSNMSHVQENFQVTVSIRNTINDITVVRDVEDDRYIFDTLDAFFDIENTSELESLLADFGVSMSNLDPLVLDTEG